MGCRRESVIEELEFGFMSKMRFVEVILLDGLFCVRFNMNLD